MRGTPGAPASRALLAPLLAGSVFAQIVCLGANGPLLAAIAATLNLLVAIAVVLLVGPSQGFWRRAAPALVCLVLLVAWAAAPGLMRLTLPPAELPQAISERPAPDLFLPGIARFTAGCALFVAAGLAGFRRRVMRSAIDWIILFGIFQIVTGLVLRGYDPDHVWGFAKSITLTRFSGTMINANANACATAATAVLAFGRSQAFMREGAATTVGAALTRVGCALTVIAATGACVIAGSRTALALTLLSVAILLMLEPASRRWLTRPIGIASLLSAAAVVVAGLLVVGDATAIERLATLGRDSVDRVMIWTHYWAVARDAPLFGYGLSAFSEANSATLRTPADAFSFWYINSAHNELLELVIEGGWVFLALMLVLGGVVLATVWREVGTRSDPILRSLVAAILLIIANSMVDIALDVPAVAALGILLTGLLWGRTLRADARDRQSQI